MGEAKGGGKWVMGQFEFIPLYGLVVADGFIRSQSYPYFSFASFNTSVALALWLNGTSTEYPSDPKITLWI
jgi:hypothetical protein